MAQTTLEPGLTWPIVLEYRLTEADVRHYALSGRVRACRKLCREQGLGMIPLVLLGSSLAGLCYWWGGLRSSGLMLASTLALLAALGMLRRDRSCRRACRLAREIGVPLDLRVSLSSGGITKDADSDGPDPARTFAWSEVVAVERVAHLTAIRLRPAGGLLLIPDRAFPDEPARDRFVAGVRGHGSSGHRETDPSMGQFRE